MTRIVLHVDTLALVGVAPAEREALVRGLQAELQCALGAPAMAQTLQRDGPRARIDAGAVRLGAAASSEALGRAIAGPVARSLWR